MWIYCAYSKRPRWNFDKSRSWTFQGHSLLSLHRFQPKSWRGEGRIRKMKVFMQNGTTTYRSAFSLSPKQSTTCKFPTTQVTSCFMFVRKPRWSMAQTGTPHQMWVEICSTNSLPPYHMLESKFIPLCRSQQAQRRPLINLDPK